MTRSGNFLAAACLLFATAAWGGLFHVGKYALNYLDPYWFTALRYTAAAAFLVGLMVVTRTPLRAGLIKQHWRKFAGLGVLGYAVFGILVFVGLNLSVPSHGAVIMATMPVTSLFISWLVDRKRPQWWAFPIAAMAVLGVGLVSGAWSSAPEASRASLIGDGMALLGTVGWILYSRGQKSFHDLSVLEYTAYTTFLAFPLIVLFASIVSLFGITAAVQVHSLPQVLPAMAYIVVFATVLSGLAYNRGVRLLGAHQGIVFINFVPVFAWLISIGLGQFPSREELMGTVLVIISLLTQAAMTTRPQPANGLVAPLVAK